MARESNVKLGHFAKYVTYQVQTIYESVYGTSKYAYPGYLLLTAVRRFDMVARSATVVVVF